MYDQIMTVAELIEELKKEDPNMTVWHEDDGQMYPLWKGNFSTTFEFRKPENNKK